MWMRGRKPKSRLILMDAVNEDKHVERITGRRMQKAEQCKTGYARGDTKQEQNEEVKHTTLKHS